MADVLIEISQFSFSINGAEILNDISLSVDSGEYLSIIGPNGAGKTTLLKCICGIHRGGYGEISVAGQPLEEYSQKKLAFELSYVPQADGRVIPFTVFEFVMMGRYPYLGPFSSPSKKDEDAVRDALDVTGTMAFEDRLLGTLSGGERQKVFIAAALAQQAKVLLLDEPTTFLDPRHEAEIYSLLAHVNQERGVTIVSVTHDINNAVLTSRSLLALKDGKAVFSGRAEDLMHEELLKDIYGKSFTLMQHPRTGKKIVAPDVDYE